MPLSPHQHQSPPLSADEIEVRIWGFVVIMVTLILAVIVVALLYSVTFVTQPIKSMAPIDQAYTKMLNDIVLLIVGGIGGVMSKRATRAVSQNLAGDSTPQPPPVGAPPGPKPSAHSVMPEFNWMGFKNAELDETWVAPPPPNTPPDYVDPAVEDIAHERAAARSET
jgi:hypothetical protein